MSTSPNYLRVSLLHMSWYVSMSLVFVFVSRIDKPPQWLSVDWRRRYRYHRGPFVQYIGNPHQRHLVGSSRFTVLDIPRSLKFQPELLPLELQNPPSAVAVWLQVLRRKRLPAQQRLQLLLSPHHLRRLRATRPQSRGRDMCRDMWILGLI